MKHNHIIHQPFCIDQFGRLYDDLVVFRPPAANSSADVLTYSDLDGTARWTLVPNFHTSSSTSVLGCPGVCASEKMTRSASAPASSDPLTPCRPSMAAGVAVTALSACGIPVPVHCRKLLTHSRRVMELVGFETNVRKRKHNGPISNWGPFFPLLFLSFFWIDG